MSIFFSSVLGILISFPLLHWTLVFSGTGSCPKDRRESCVANFCGINLMMYDAESAE